MIPFGLPDVYVFNHAHVAHLFAGEDERLTVLAPFVASGIQAGDHCLCIAEDPDYLELRQRLGELGVDAKDAWESGQLTGSPGAPTVGGMTDIFLKVAAEAQEAGRSLIRVGADMTWALGQMPNAERLLEWEVTYDIAIKPRANFIALCQYDHTRFNGKTIMYALESHPLCVIGSVVQENPFYRDPREVLRELQSEKREGITKTGL
jgi:hypothetical protein